MTRKAHTFRDGGSGSAITIRVIPRSGRNEVAEILDDGTVKIRLTATGNEVQINEALLRFLAEVLEVPDSAMDIVAGQTGKDKLVSILNVDTTTAQERILKHLA